MRKKNDFEKPPVKPYSLPYKKNQLTPLNFLQVQTRFVSTRFVSTRFVSKKLVSKKINSFREQKTREQKKKLVS